MRFALNSSIPITVFRKIKLVKFDKVQSVLHVFPLNIIKQKKNV